MAITGKPYRRLTSCVADSSPAPRSCRSRAIRIPAGTAPAGEGTPGDAAGAECWDEFERKRLSREAAERLNERMARHWSDMARQIEAIHISSHTLEKALGRAGAPTKAQDVGVPDPDYETAVLGARYLRDRFTFLDLADDAGCLGDIWRG